MIWVQIVDLSGGWLFARATQAWAWHGSLTPQSASVVQASGLFTGAGSAHVKRGGAPVSEVAVGVADAMVVGALVGVVVASAGGDAVAEASGGAGGAGGGAAGGGEGRGDAEEERGEEPRSCAGRHEREGSYHGGGRAPHERERERFVDRGAGGVERFDRPLSERTRAIWGRRPPRSREAARTRAGGGTESRLNTG